MLFRSPIMMAFVTLLVAQTATAQHDPSALPARLQSLVEDQVDASAEDPVHNAILLVETPEFRWCGAAGLADGVAEMMTPDHQFKIASIGKTYTATIVLQLMEEGRLNLHDTLDRFFTPAVLDLDSLHVHDEVSYGRQITIDHLLGHTSGLRDYMEDPRFFEDINKDPGRQWGSAGILQTYFSYGTHRQAAFPPGEGYLYADPNYVLLGMVIEAVTGSTLAQQYKERIFTPLDLTCSYLEFYEEPREGCALSHAFLGALDVNLMVNTSFDWGGGGIVSTADEVNRFFKALLHGELFAQPGTLATMLAAADRGFGNDEFDYGYGLMKRTIAGLTFYGHGGAYDCDMFHCPEQGISICMTLNQMLTHGRRNVFVTRSVELVTLGK